MTSPSGAPATEPAPNRDYVCGRCKTNTGNRTQGHYWAYCKVTRKMRSFHFCCPGDCALDAVAATAAVAEAVDRSTPAAAAEALREIRAATSSAPMNALDQLPSGLTLAALRERAVLFGGNGCEVPAPDLLCLLDALEEARNSRCGCDNDPIECGHQAALGQALERSDRIANALSVAEAENRRLREELAEIHESALEAHLFGDDLVTPPGPVTPDSGDEQLARAFNEAAWACEDAYVGPGVHHYQPCCGQAGIAAVRPLIEAEAASEIARLRERIADLSGVVQSVTAADADYEAEIRAEERARIADALADLPRQPTTDVAPAAAEEWRAGWAWGWFYAMEAVDKAIARGETP